MNTEMKPKTKPIPTLLSKGDALLYAANRLDEQASDLMLLKIFADALKKIDAPQDEKGEASLVEMRILASGIVDAEIQEKAMRDAATEIRQMANEVKLVEARASSHGCSPAFAR